MRYKAVITEEGELVFYKPKLLQQYLDENKLKIVDVSLELHDPDLTKNQQGYYRVINRFLTRETEDFGGWDEKDLHDYAISVVGTEEVIKYIGEKPVRFYHRISMATASKKKASEFIDRWILYLWHNHQIKVPPPEHA